MWDVYFAGRVASSPFSRLQGANKLRGPEGWNLTAVGTKTYDGGRRGWHRRWTNFDTSSQVKILSRMARKQRSCIYLSGELDTSGSPDLNSLDYELWDIMEPNACQKLHPNLVSLKWSIIEDVVKIPLSLLYMFNITDNNYETLAIYWPCRWEQCSINDTDYSILILHPYTEHNNIEPVQWASEMSHKFIAKWLKC